MMEVLAGFLPGAVAGAVYVIVSQPAEELKFRLQHFPKHYQGYTDCWKTTIRTEGLFRGLYSGVVLNLYVHMIENAILFGVLPDCANFVRRVSGSDEYEELSLVEKSFSGSLASIFTSVFHCPLTVIRSKMEDVRVYELQTVINSNFTTIKKPIGTHLLTLSMIRTFGFYELYSRFAAIMLREMFGVFFYFGGFYAARDTIDRMFEEDDHEISFTQIMVSGGVGGACYCIAVNPVLVVHERTESFNQFWPVMFDIVRKGGPFRLFKGLKPVLFIQVPTHAVLFGAISTLNDYFFYY